MPETPLEECTHEGMHRRAFLGVTGTALGYAALSTVLGAAPANAAPAHRPGSGLSFAMISDTHVNLTAPQSTTWLTQVYASIAKRDPDAVLHCGDITDTGAPDEYAKYGTIVPAALRGKIHYSPGNHDVRWDPSAKEQYHSHFGPTPYSFDIDGVHFVGLDPTELLQEPGHYGPGGLSWLTNDLRHVNRDTPVFLFQHFPMGNTFYYVDDQVTLLDLIADYNVRGIFAGHIHKEVVSRFNGLTQLGLNAVLNGALYYWVTKTTDEHRMPILSVIRVNIAADGTETETAVATVPLTGSGLGRPQRPQRVNAGRVSNGILPVTIDLAPAARPTQVGIDLYAQTVFGGAATPSWQALSARSPREWTGSIDVSALAPGAQRLRLQVTAADGTWWEDTAQFTVPSNAADPTQEWHYQLPGSVQGGIALAGSGHARTAIAASSSGDVVALRPGPHSAFPIWKTRVGPAYRLPGVDRAGRTLFVPSSDHHLYALDAGSGHQRWHFDAGEPVMSAPAVATVHGRESVFFTAGQGLFAVDAVTGRRLWSVPGHSFSSGKIACDGNRVYTAAADGFARAYDAATGALIWSYQMVTGDEHHLALYSGWDNVIAIGSGVMIVATVSDAWGLDQQTGALRWTVPGSAMYAPAVILGDGTALLTTEFGIMTRIDLATGATHWQTNLAVRVFNAGVVIVDGIAWAQSVDGKLIGVRVTDGARQGWLQNSLVYSFSTPAVIDNTLIVGDQNGVVSGVRLP